VQTSQPIFSPPIRWILGVLSWLAFAIAAYLAYTTVTNSAVAGCVVGSKQGCDAVLNSAWSKWLGIPVAVVGLNCYAVLAGLSAILIAQANPNRWVTTAFTLLATVAAGASVWFIALQVFVIGDFCMYCLATDLCGIAIGALAGWSVYQWWSGASLPRSSGSTSTTLSALRSAIPSSTRLAPVAATRAAPSKDTVDASPAAPRAPSTAVARTVPLVGSVAPSSRASCAAPPSMPIAYGGALAMLIVLIGGQIVFPAKTFKVQPANLNATVDLSAQNGTKLSGEPSTGAETHVTMRIDTEGETRPAEEKSDSTESPPANGNGVSESPPEPKRSREIKLLGGKLTLDLGDEPVIGPIDAPHVVVELISYDCSHCRKTNSHVKRALSRYGDQVALVVLVLPLESTCNKLVNPDRSSAGACSTARTAIALAKLRPSTFSQFHNFLMSGDEKKPPSSGTALNKAFGIVDRDKLMAMRESDDVHKKVASYVKLYESLIRSNSGNKEFGLPIQILGDHVMSGSVEKTDDIYKAWEEHLGVKAN
jgi:uncharacterized membrane protein